jgi:UDP-glucuronate 4-epimerase
MAVLVTGSAGFIGAHVSRALLARGEQVVGVDNLNDYYDPALKRARLAWLGTEPGFAFEQADIADLDAITELARRHRDSVTDVVHLAAQAGVRHSLIKPFDYVQANLQGHMVMLEVCRHGLRQLRHLVYASSSSVYGGNTKTPFAVVGEDNADAHLKRTLMGREVVVAVTDGKLDFGPWEQIFYGEFDGKRRKRVLVKIIGE